MTETPMTPESTPSTSKPNWMLPASILLAAIIVAGALLYTHNTPANSAAPAPTVEAPAGDLAKLRPVDSSDHIQGNPNAPIKLIEYSDLECPYCKIFHQVMTKDIYSKWVATGKVEWVYRHFPLNIHPKATPEANAAECAGHLGGNDIFWKFVDNVFTVTPSNNQLDPAELPDIAGELGLDVTAFNKCVATNQYAAIVKKDSDNGDAIGVDGTPFPLIVDSKNVIRVFREGAPSGSSADAKALLADLNAGYSKRVGGGN